MTVKIFNGTLLHEAIISHFIRLCTTCSEAMIHHPVYLIKAFHG